MTPGGICWVDLPGAPGHEQAGRRPATVVQSDGYAATSPLVIVVPLTMALNAARFPGTLVIEATPETGLREPSVALVFQIRAADRRKLHGRLGYVGPEALSAIYTLLDRLLGRDSAQTIRRSQDATIEEP